MTHVLFVGEQNTAQLARALHERRGGEARVGNLGGGELHEAVVEAIEELGATPVVPATDPAWADHVVDVDEWQLAEPVGLCLEEVRELRAVIDARVHDLPL